MTIQYSNKKFLIIIISFVVAAMLNIYPLSPAVAFYRPMILIMVLIYWTMFQPRYVGLGTAFVVGVCCDLLFETMLGQQAFCALLATFMVRFISQYFHGYSVSNSWLLGALCLTVFQVSLWVIQFITQDVLMFHHWRALAVSILLWLPMSVILSRIVR